MIHVRPFLNHDPPAIANVINTCCNLEAVVSTNLLEFAVFAKTYFRRDHLFVATIAEELLGFVHLGSASQEDLQTGTLTISNFLVSNSDMAIAKALLDYTLAYAETRGIRCLRIGTPPDKAEYYNGISTHFLNVGVPQTHPILPILETLGFKTIDSWHCLQFDIHNRQIPFTRSQMSLRRTHVLDQLTDPDFKDHLLNSVYSHLATSQLDLTHRQTGETEASITFACLAQSYPNWPNGGVDIIRYTSRTDLDLSHYEFLLCEILRQLPQTGLSPLRLHVDAKDTQRMEIAEAIGFERMITSSHVEYLI